MSERKLRLIFLLSSVGCFIIALTQKCYCTSSTCGDSLAVFLMGILGLFYGGAAITWLANPFLLASWITFKKWPKASLVLNLIAFLISLSFLLFNTVIDDEAGHYNKIVSYKLGYWLWVTSSLILLTGNFIQRQKNKKPVTPA